MENLVLQGIDEILEGVKILSEKYQKLEIKVLEQESTISNLKVETDQYKTEIEVLKKEIEEQEEEKRELVLLKSINSENPTEEVFEAGKNKEANIQSKLDGFLEDIDQCIQIIQTKV